MSNTESQATPATDSTWQDRWQHTLMDTYGTPALNLVKGQGSYVWDSEGKKYLDLLSGIAVNALGHAHPAIVEAVTTQLQTLGHTSNVFAHPQVIELAGKVTSLVGTEEAADARVFFCNSGAEANEAAFKIARATGRPKILAAERGFHGRTMGSLALTGQPDKRKPFEPMPAGVEYYPYGDLDAVDAMADENTAAIFLEAIQGETGVIPAPEGFLAGLRRICDERGILLVVDEVQAGMGRTGAWFGFQSDGSGVVPDVITLAKGMHGTTFGGNPVVCAAANAVIDEIKEQNLLENVQQVGAQLVAALQDHPRVTEIRGRGLMLGVVLDTPCELDPADYGILLNKPSPEVLRIVPPLNLSPAEADEAASKITAMLDDLPTPTETSTTES